MIERSEDFIQDGVQAPAPEALRLCREGGSGALPFDDWYERDGAPLSPGAAAWLPTLPDAVRPNVLARTYPRIVNRICRLWALPSQCDDYLTSLLSDERGGRQGFPAPIAEEISMLALHYAQLVPHRHSVW